nr:lactoylglutathione lyase-like [Ipomoea batatas]
MMMEIEEVRSLEQPLPLLSLNHVSILVKDVWDSVRFYEDILGFCSVKRPSSLNFRGAWLYNYGIGIHLLENESLQHCDDTVNHPRPINPKDNHISFQCTDVVVVRKRLEEMGMRYVTAVVEEDGITVDQVFFHDPDGYMIEICNCENIPMRPVASLACPFKNPNFNKMEAQHPRAAAAGGAATGFDARPCRRFMETTLMMESLSMDMLNFSF